MIKPLNTTPNQILVTKAVPCRPAPAPDALTQAVLLEPAPIWPKEIIQLVQDLKDTASSLGENCAGLASNQIWDKVTPPPAVFVVKTADGGWAEFINPSVSTSGKSYVHKEGCFSKPGLEKKVKREMNSTITFQTLDSAEVKKMKLFLKDTFTAIAVQHEFDHLMGKLI